jgi:hypothetical protein
VSRIPPWISALVGLVALLVSGSTAYVVSTARAEDMPQRERLATLEQSQKDIMRRLDEIRDEIRDLRKTIERKDTK